MKKLIASIVSIVGMVALLGTVIGCTITPEAMKVIAQNAGLGAAVTWIAYDNPTTAEKVAVVGVLDIIKDNATNVIAGVTYSEVLYPEIEKYAHSGKVPVQYIPAVLAGSYAVLGGIDMLFAMHPEYKKDQNLALSTVTCFVDGAKHGLSLTDRDPVIIQAKKMSGARAKIYKK
jgi:hypothetical protein